MALIKCPECKQPISDKASFCPSCGFPIVDFIQNCSISLPTASLLPQGFEVRGKGRGTKIFIKDGIFFVYKRNAIICRDNVENIIIEKFVSPKRSFGGAVVFNVCNVDKISFEFMFDLYFYNFSKYFKQYYPDLFDNLEIFNSLEIKYGHKCPRCGSLDYHTYVQETYIPSKTKTRYTMNLNPLKPFTLFNKKEKVISKPTVKSESMFQCNSCGHIYK